MYYLQSVIYVYSINVLVIISHVGPRGEAGSALCAGAAPRPRHQAAEGNAEQRPAGAESSRRICDRRRAAAGRGVAGG